MNKKLKYIRTNLTWYSFIIVSLVSLLVFLYIPFFSTIHMSFTNMKNFVDDYEFVGFKNYITLFTTSGFPEALKNTLLLAIYSLSKIPLAFLLAFAINSLGRTKKQTFFRVMFYMPYVIAGASVVIIFRQVFVENGLLNMVLSWLTGTDVAIGWVTDPNYSHLSATILDVWMSLGYFMLMCLSSLQAIPTELYEAAEVDGAKTFKKLWYITIPLMKNCFTFLLVTSMISGFARFSDLYVLGANSTKGLPRGTLQTLMMYIYSFSFGTPRFGISSAGSVVLAIITLIFSIINMKISGFMKEAE